MEIKTYKDLISRVEKFKIDKNIDLSSGEDLSIGIMNLISIEEHLFFTSQKLISTEKTKDKKYLNLLNEVRLMRTDLMKQIVKVPEGEVWCISKHLLSSSMRLMEVGTKELKKAEALRGPERARRVEGAQKLFEKSYKLYSLFWGLNLSTDKKASTLKMPDDKSAFSKLGALVQKAIDCCRE